MNNILGIAGKALSPITDSLNNSPDSNIKQISAIRAISESFITISQDISQSALSSQIVSLNCSMDATGTSCLKCYDTLKAVNASEEKMLKTCRNVCSCSIEDVKMNQFITLNTDTFFESDVSQEFITQFKNSIYTQAKQSGASIFNDTDLNSLQESITNIYNELRTSDFKAKIDALQTLQLVELKGAGSIKTVDLDSTVDYVSKAVNTTKSLQNLIVDIDKKILLVSSQVTKSTMQAIIELFVSVIFLILLACIGYLSISTIFDIIALL
jgi:hypothetical protein